MTPKIGKATLRMAYTAVRNLRFQLL